MLFDQQGTYLQYVLLTIEGSLMYNLHTTTTRHIMFKFPLFYGERTAIITTPHMNWQQSTLGFYTIKPSKSENCNITTPAEVS